MPSTVFLSWQTDTPSRTGRNFLRQVLNDACRSIAADTSLSEAQRNTKVDSDTQGISGQPPIVDTILKKIEAASVFVADMTFVAQRPKKGGRLPNPNVSIEYGYALKALTHERVICVMNSAYGKPTARSLPFDLAHARWPTTYHLPEDAAAEAKARERKRLAKVLESHIRACLGEQAPAASRRFPLTELRRLAVAAGWSADYRAATIGDNDWYSFITRLRQAGVDGTMPFFGKRYLSDHGKDVDGEPLVPIPPAHFQEYGFDVVQLAEADNYDILSYRPDVSQSAGKGRIYRDFHVDEAATKRWLEQEGRPPAPADVAVRVTDGGAAIATFKPVCSLVIRNIGNTDFDRCLVEMTEMSGTVPDNLTIPFLMRTDAQIRDKLRGPFVLLRGQEAVIPLLFHRPQRSNEWFFADERGTTFFLSANPTKLILRIYGGPSPGNALVFVDTDAGWNAMPSVKTVPSDFTLKKA